MQAAELGGLPRTGSGGLASQRSAESCGSLGGLGSAAFGDVTDPAPRDRERYLVHDRAAPTFVGVRELSPRTLSKGMSEGTDPVAGLGGHHGRKADVTVDPDPRSVPCR